MAEHAYDRGGDIDDDRRLADFYDHADTSAFDGEDAEFEPSVNPRISQSIAFDREDMQELRRVATGQGVSVRDLIRTWVLERLRPTPQPKVTVTMGPVVQGPPPGISPAQLAAMYEHGRRQGRYEAGG